MKNNKKFKSAIVKIIIIGVVLIVLSYIGFTFNNVLTNL